MRASQYRAASGSLERTDLCRAEMRLKCSSPDLSYKQNLALQGVGQRLAVDLAVGRKAGSDFQSVEGGTGVAAGSDGDFGQKFIIYARCEDGRDRVPAFPAPAAEGQ